MSALLRATRVVARIGSWFGGVLILASALIVTVDVLLRKFLNVTLGGADLIAGFCLAMASAWGFAFTFLDRGHIRIDTFYLRMPAKLQLTADIIGVVLMIAFFGTVTWFALGVTQQSIALGSRTMSTLQVPLAVPQVVWVAGLIFFLFAMVLTLANALMLARNRRLAEVRRLIGSRSLDEEIADERAAGGAGS